MLSSGGSSLHRLTSTNVTSGDSTSFVRSSGATIRHSAQRHASAEEFLVRMLCSTDAVFRRTLNRNCEGLEGEKCRVSTDDSVGKTNAHARHSADALAHIEYAAAVFFAITRLTANKLLKERKRSKAHTLMSWGLAILNNVSESRIEQGRGGSKR